MLQRSLGDGWVPSAQSDCERAKAHQKPFIQKNGRSTSGGVVIDLYLNISIGDIDGGIYGNYSISIWDTWIYHIRLYCIRPLYCRIMDLCFVHLKLIRYEDADYGPEVEKSSLSCDWHLGTQIHLKPRRYQVPETG